MAKYAFDGIDTLSQYMTILRSNLDMANDTEIFVTWGSFIVGKPGDEAQGQTLIKNLAYLDIVLANFGCALAVRRCTPGWLIVYRVFRGINIPNRLRRRSWPEANSDEMIGQLCQRITEACDAVDLRTYWR